MFYDELIEYPQVDFVIRGAETSSFIDLLLDELEVDHYESIPNLCWKDKNGDVMVNEFKTIDTYLEHVDWGHSDSEINYFVTIPGAGCEYNCTLCGGSNYSMKKHHGVKDGFSEKDLTIFLEELKTIKNHKGNSKRLITLHHWFEDEEVLIKVLDTVQDGNIKTIHYTLYNLLPERHIKLISQYKMKPVFELSIESHNKEVRKRCGKPPYSNEDIEF